jgi:hypothetical protein
MLRGFGLAAGAASLLLVIALGVYLVVRPTGVTLIVLAGVALLAALSCFAYAAWTMRRAPNDRRVARFVEERVPELEDRVATAVEFGERFPDERTPVVEGLLADAVTRLRSLDFERVVSPETIKRATLIAGLGAGLLLIVAVAGRTPARRALDAVAFYVFPARLNLEVQPGDAKVMAGESLQIRAQIRGGDKILTPILAVEEGPDRRTVEMAPSGKQDEFVLTLTGIQDAFTYRVSAGPSRSSAFNVRVLRPPHVKRVDLSYEYPSAIGLKDRVEEDGGDIYAPAGTTVRLRVLTDKPVASGEMVMAGGARLPFRVNSDVLEATMKVAEDGSYRIALGDADGLRNPGDTEYFIRTLEDRPPEVRIIRPGGDQEVTRLQEVTIEARAEDDYGIGQFDLVYAVRGGRERAVPLKKGAAGLAVSGSYTLYLEDLDVQPGDFVTYFARARDIGRGKKSTEARSDIFFLEVKPYEEEFVAAQSQMGGSPANETSLQELAEAQKNIIVATWKLDRRALDGQSGRSQQDILQIARAQGELQSRTRGLADQMRSTGNPRGRGRGGQPAPVAANPGMEALIKAAAAMEHAKEELQALKTKAATPHEMEALNQLLKAIAEDRKRQQINTSQQQASNGTGSNRSSRDLSSLFDRELRRQEETNYETPPAPEKRQQTQQSEALEKVRDLARRQQQLGQEQQDLANKQAQMSPEETKRQLERLTREQSELRQQAEELARDLAQSSQQGQGGSAKDMRDASEQMRNAAAQLRRNDPKQASENSKRALDKLNDLESEMRGGQPDERRRALGDMTLEARQLADAQREIANESRRLADSKAPADSLRRLAGDEERLADRMQQLERSARKLASGEQSGQDRQSLGDIANDMSRQQLERRMRESASSMRERSGSQNRQPQDSSKTPDGQRQAGAQDSSKSPDGQRQAGSQDGSRSPDGQRQAGSQGQGGDERQIADALDAIAKQLSGAAGRGGDTGSDELSDQLAQAQRTEQQMKEIERRVERLRQQIQQVQDGKAGGQQGNSDQLAKLQAELQQALKEGEGLISELARARGELSGGTPQGQQLSQSAPGTESFKQDFSNWESLKKGMTLALEQVQVLLAQKLAEKQNRERLNAGANDRVPDEYRKLVDKYYESLAKKP